ncbi:hypothetical protein QBC34DRAFT_397385 [Podospora aff. communis PSN243]|uniref:MICOS complex subunit mic19 n=1 Tax=Podospora aff. communis PSN243 TaxID=3040156 RepID=A0AAV9GZ08_9PEZI|nr:hypothetical protein QBC34DRAFT_397385 [Podospora aff. communis PSN243]
MYSVYTVPSPLPGIFHFSKCAAAIEGRWIERNTNAGASNPRITAAQLTRATMGSSSSKPSGSSAPQVWNSSTSVSHDLSSALQSSPESDTSRQQAIELEIQTRVAAELKRLRDEEAAALKEAQQKLSEQSSSDSTQPGKESKVTRQSVSKEVEALRAKLQERRKVRELPEGVETARNEVVRCLRENDRRPLDCWKEVEAFKEEVRRLEKGWVDKVVS